MKKNIVLAFLALAGSIIGYLVGRAGNASGWSLFREVYSGAFLIYFFGMALFEMKDYGILVGAALGLFVSVSLDLLAGSNIEVRNKLSYMFICSFTGWAFWYYWKPVLIGGGIGATAGFVLGMFHSHFFGKVCLLPGFLNASLWAAQMSMIGMAAASLFMKSVWYQFVKNRRAK